MTSNQCIQLIADEVERAESKFPGFNTRRAHHSIIEEEYIEFRDAIFKDDFDGAFKEVIQIAAMCVRYMKDHAPSSVRLFH